MAEQDLDALEQTSATTGQSEQTSADKSKAEAESKKANWQDDPEYRRQQAERDRETARLANEAHQAKAEAEANRARLESLEDQAYGKDDYGKMQLVAQRAAREAETLKQRLAAYEAQEAADRAKSEAAVRVSAQYDGVTPSDLLEAKDYDDMHRLARKAEEKAKTAKQQERDETREANKPDLGGGGRSTAKTRLESDYEAAFKEGDSVRMARLLREMRDKKP